MHIWIDNPSDLFPESIINKFSPESITGKIKFVTKNILADFLRVFKRHNIPTQKIWFFVLTQNNFDALKEIKKFIPDSIYTSFFRFKSTINENSTHYFYLPFRFFRNFLYPIYWLIYYFNNKKKAGKYYDLLMTVNGSYEECLRLLKKNKPKAIVFANDHLIIARSMLLAANHLGIKTYYVQHASVSEYFPPLEFSYALLEGMDSQLKYAKCGEVKSIVHLCGMSKFDQFSKQLNVKKKVGVVGFAFNLIDEIEEVFKFVSQLIEDNSNLKILLRAHPGDSRNMELFRNFSFSDSKTEPAFNFLSKIDCLISGESSIHLEAVLLDVYPLHFSFDKKIQFDYYGFVKNNLVEHFPDINDLNEKLKELQFMKPKVQQRAIPYNAAIGSDFYGSTSKKIADIILDTMNN